MAIPGGSTFTPVSVTFNKGGSSFGFGRAEVMPAQRIIKANQKLDESVDGFQHVRVLGGDPGYQFLVPMRFKHMSAAAVESLHTFLDVAVGWTDSFTVRDSFNNLFEARWMGDFDPTEGAGGEFSLTCNLELVDDLGFTSAFDNGVNQYPYLRAGTSAYWNWAYQDADGGPVWSYSRWKRNVTRFQDGTHVMCLLSPEMRFVRLKFKNIPLGDVNNLIRFFERSDVNWCKEQFYLGYSADFRGDVQLASTEFRYQVDAAKRFCSFDLLLRRYFD